MLCDESHTMLENYGVWGLKKFMGREYMGISRVTYILDENHVVKEVIDKVKTKFGGSDAGHNGIKSLDEFIGKDYAKKDDSQSKLVPLMVETNDIDATYYEAVMKGDKSIGYVTSGGFAHFVNKSVAFTYINKKELNSEKGIQVEINGDMFNCLIIKEPLYDPSGQKMRS